MKAIIMAGGKGSRFTPLKPLVEVCGYPMFYHVYRRVREIAEDVYIAITPSSPLVFSSLPKIITKGLGYEEDVVEAVSKVGFPVLVLPSDTPLIPKGVLEYLITHCRSSICNLVGINGYVGISLWNSLNFNDYEDVNVNYHIYNVNKFEDYIKVKNLCYEMDTE
ncbi:MAG: NTP transferase domain-containing protein [Sulfolobus sp.]